MQASFEVLVVSYASHAVIAELLDSLTEQMPGVSVAIREHSPDAADLAALQDIAASRSLTIRVEHDPTNPGFGAGSNALAATSTADYLILLNPDTRVLAWPWAHTPPPRETVVGSLMVDSGPPSEHYGRRYRIRDEISRSWLRRRPRRPSGKGYVSGAGLLIDRASFASLGGFDEQFFLFYEDIDLCLRANAAGFPTVVDERWRVHHTRHHSTRSQLGRSLGWSYESALHFHDKHGSPVRGYAAYVSADSALRAVWHTARRNPEARRAYVSLARRAAGDMVRYRRHAV